jgi:hypothetical protein
MAMIVLAIVVSLVGIAFHATTGPTRLQVRSRDYSQGNAAAEAAIEFAFAKWRTWIRNNGGIIPTAAEAASSIGINVASVQPLFDSSPAFSGAVLTHLSIVPVDRNLRPVDPSLSPVNQRKAMRTLAPAPDMPKRVGASYGYQVTAEVHIPSSGADQKVKVRLSRILQKTDVSMWQAMMWYEGDLELFPSPHMPLYGWIHTNSNGYLCHQLDPAHETLQINGDFSFYGNRNTLNKGLDSQIKNADGLVYGVSRLQQAMESYWKDWEEPVWNNGGYDKQVEKVDRLDPLAVTSAAAINTTDTNPNNDSLREIIERPYDTNSDGKRTAADDTEHFKERRFYNVADFKIIVNRSLPVSSRVKILDGNDNVINPSTVPFAGSIISQVLNTSSTTGLPSTKEIYDYREAGNITNNSAWAASSSQGKITVTNLDVSKLTPILNANPDRFVNGVIYFKDETPNGTTGVNNKKALRLLKGGSLPDRGMTIVTEDGVYIQGDYNTGTTYDASGAVVNQPQSNNLVGADPLNNAVAGYSIKPAAVIGDAVMFLSNSWSESYSHTTATTSRNASPTTFNTAFLCGHVPTNSAYPTNPSTQRSGGGINFPRVLENWGGKALTYHGSMIQLFDSKVFKTSWSQHIYGAPARPWNFENRFLDTPPPGPLEITRFTKGPFIRQAPNS